MEFKKSLILPSIISNDCDIEDNRVWFTASHSGQVLVCDLDLDACEILVTDDLLVGG